MIKIIALAACAMVLFDASAGAQTPSLQDYTGVYSVRGQPEMAINLRRMGPQEALQYTNIRDGATRLLMGGADGAFVAGDALIPSGDPALRITFRGGAVRVCDTDGENCVRARQMRLRQREVQFESAGLMLHATLWLPPGRSRPHPALVVSQGSEDTDRSGLDPVPQVLAARGYAVLVYDKPGTGQSPGNWEEQGVEELTVDFLAAVGWMSRQTHDVDVRRIGYLGFSEGGWVTIEASRQRRPHALIALSGGVRTKGDAFIYKNRRLLEEQGLTGEALDAALRESEQEIADASARAASGQGASGFDHRVAYDPAVAWRGATFPVLYLGGEYDVLQDQAAAHGELETLLREAGNTDYTLRILPRANHALFETSAPAPSAWQRMQGVSRYSPEFWPTLLGWTDAHFRRH